MIFGTAMLLYLIPFLAVTVFIEMESFGFATTIMVFALALYSYLSHWAIFSYVKLHWFYCLKLTLVYLVIGVAWSFVKWFLFLLGFKAALNEAKRKYIEDWNSIHKDNKIISLNGYVIPEERVDNFRSEISYTFYKGLKLNTRPLAVKAKSKIVAWMTFWPCSMVGFILNDPVRRVFNFLFDSIKNSYQKMADKILPDAELK